MSRTQNNIPTLTKPQKWPIRPPKKSKITPKLSPNQMSELKETWKIKVVALDIVDPKTIFEPDPDPQNSPFGIQKANHHP